MLYHFIVKRFNSISTMDHSQFADGKTMGGGNLAFLKANSCALNSQESNPNHQIECVLLTPVNASPVCLSNSKMASGLPCSRMLSGLRTQSCWIICPQTSLVSLITLQTTSRGSLWGQLSRKGGKLSKDKQHWVNQSLIPRTTMT